MQQDVRHFHNEARDTSHGGHPTVIRTADPDGPGRPRIEIDPDFLRWAASVRSTTGIARFLNVSRSTVRTNLLAHGIRAPGTNPFPDEQISGIQSESNVVENAVEALDNDDLLDPSPPAHLTTPGSIISSSLPDVGASSSAEMPMSDDDLDKIIQSIRVHFRRAGITILHGILRSLGHRISRERIRIALIRIDPVHRIFQRITIRRRKYSVPGPNALWHHDGQHGMPVSA